MQIEICFHMKRRIGAVVIALGLVAAVYAVSTYLSISNKENQVYALWAEVEQTCFDKIRIINDIVVTTKNMPHNEELFDNLKKTLAETTECIVGADKLTKDGFAKFIKSQDAVNIALYDYMAGESWATTPEMKKKKTEINDLDNRISVEIENYSNGANDFNTYISRIRHKYIARVGGFKTKYCPKSPDKTIVE